MGLYCRFFDRSDEPISADDFIATVLAADPSFTRDESTLLHQGRILADFTLNIPGDGLFDEEIAEFLEYADDQPGWPLVSDTLKSTQRIFCFQVLNGIEDDEERFNAITQVLAEIDREGLFQFDGVGFYQEDELIWEES